MLGLADKIQIIAPATDSNTVPSGAPTSILSVPYPSCSHFKPSQIPNCVSTYDLLSHHFSIHISLTVCFWFSNLNYTIYEWIE